MNSSLKNYFKKIIFITVICQYVLFSITASEIIKKSQDLVRGINSSYAEMSMTIVRPTWERTVAFKSWSKGTTHSLTLITAPAKDKGQTFLKRNSEMWNWNPVINRMIKLPPSMMAQGWMGSDYSNDDILKESSLTVDYTHKLINEEKVDNILCYKILLTPKKEAAVVWGSIKMYISKNNFQIIKAMYFDEDEILIKTERGYDIKNFDGRKILSKIEIIPAEEEGYKTVIHILNATFDKPIDDRFFSEQNMKRVR